ARVYGAEPQFLLASATIANPGELASSLLGVDTTVIGEDAAPRAERTIALWNPELIDAELGLRASSLGDASRLMAELVQRELRTICFAKSRKQAELIHRMTADRVDAATASRLAPYRAGYTPPRRRPSGHRWTTPPAGGSATRRSSARPPCRSSRIRSTAGSGPARTTRPRARHCAPRAPTRSP